MLEDFIKENLIKTHDFITIPTKVVYDRYKLTQGKKGLSVLGKVSFYSDLEDLGIVRDKKSGKSNYRGWYLKPCKY